MFGADRGNEAAGEMRLYSRIVGAALNDQQRRARWQPRQANFRSAVPARAAFIRIMAAENRVQATQHVDRVDRLAQRVDAFR